MDGKIIFGTTTKHQGQVCGRLPQGSLKGEMSGSERVKCQDLHGWAEKRRAMLGQAKLALCFQIPSQASLHGILKTIAHSATQMALRFRFAQKLLGENAGLRLASKRGYVVKKHLQARLRVSFP